MSKYGVIAKFDNPQSLVHAAEKVRDEGFTKFDCHSPFPIHGMDDAMGLKRSKLGYVIGAMGLTGALFGFGLQTWIHSIEYPMNISGKPYFAYPAYAIITFELMVLFSAFFRSDHVFELAIVWTIRTFSFGSEHVTFELLYTTRKYSLRTANITGRYQKRTLWS